MNNTLDSEMPANTEIPDDGLFGYTKEELEIIHDEKDLQVFKYSGIYKNTFIYKGKGEYEDAFLEFSEIDFDSGLEVMRVMMYGTYEPYRVGFYDDCYYNLSNGKYVFIKEGEKQAELTKSQALDMLLNAVNNPKEMLRRAPRMREIFEPSKKTHFTTDKGVEAINLYRPSEYVKASKGKVKTIPSAINFLLDHLIPDKATKISLINALACHLKTGKAIHLGWIFVGVEGAGKGTIMHVIKEIFGMQNFQKSKLKAFTGDKVKGTPNKLICYVDESANQAEMYEIVENLKAIIANEQYASRALYSDEVTVKNHTMFFFTVNSFGFKLSENDRRFNIIECKTPLNKAVGDTGIFYKKIANELQSFADYLLNYEVDISMTREVVETPSRTKMINNHLPVMERIAKVILENSLEPLLDSIDEDKYSERIGQIEQELSDIHRCGSVKGTVIALLSKGIFNLIDDIDPKHYKKHAITGFIKNKWSYETKKVGNTSTKVYIIDANNDKHYNDETMCFSSL